MPNWEEILILEVCDHRKRRQETHHSVWCACPSVCEDATLPHTAQCTCLFSCVLCPPPLRLLIVVVTFLWLLLLLLLLLLLWLL